MSMLGEVLYCFSTWGSCNLVHSGLACNGHDLLASVVGVLVQCWLVWVEFQGEGNGGGGVATCMVWELVSQ
jgi:hypothetical protein